MVLRFYVGDDVYLYKLNPCFINVVYPVIFLRKSIINIFCALNKENYIMNVKLMVGKGFSDEKNAIQLGSQYFMTFFY